MGIRILAFPSPSVRQKLRRCAGATAVREPARKRRSLQLASLTQERSTAHSQ